jgi:AraC family transcriptional regulator of adaptative response/methylated-DNA-[protein]-cysteine methyltransferase
MRADTFSHQAGNYQRVAQAIDYVENNFHRQPGLDEIAASVHLSKYHFQRLFKEWAGISPAQFLQFLTLAHAKKRLAAAQSVYDAALDVGLSGSSRLHDLFVTFEGITPGEYKKQGAGLRINYGFHNTPFGLCLLAATGRGICRLSFVSNGEMASAEEQLATNWPQAVLVRDQQQTQTMVKQIFLPATARSARPFHLLLKGTNFQVNVWHALLAIPPGAMVSYQDVAAYIGQPQATRAVARAIAHNPVGYLIPCHRVIRKNCQVQGYQWGNTRKRAMLGWVASQQVGY